MASNITDLDRLSEPLDSREIVVDGVNGISSKVPALHLGFMQPRNYVNFKPVPLLPDTGQVELHALEEEWLESNSYLEEDLHWTLSLPHNRFWSQVVYDEKLHKCLESYLFQAPRRYDSISVKLKDEIRHSLSTIHKLIFRVFLRMSTYKESKDHHITPKYFGELLYDYFLFDIPKIMDICALYRVEDNYLLTKMVQNIFSNQPNYFDDLSRASQVVLEAFSSIEEQLATLQDLRNNTSNSQANSATLSSYHDVVNYIVDVCYTLHSFLEIYSPACQIFYQNGVSLRIASFYETIFPIIEREIFRNRNFKENERLLQEMKSKVSLSKTLLAETFRNILVFCCIDGIVHTKSTSESQTESDAHLNHFFDIFADIVLAKIFLQDYNVLFPIESDFELFADLGLKLDMQRVAYISSCIHDTGVIERPTFTSTAEHGACPKVKKPQSDVNAPPSFQNAVDVLRGRDSADNKSSRQNGTNNPSEEEIDSMVDSICDCLNLTDRNLVEKCLQHYNYDPDRTLDAYCTDTIPDHLRCYNEEAESSPSSEKPSNSILLERKSIFDNDEFDLFRRNDVNMDNVHLGKKNKIPSAYETLSRDKDSDFLKEFTLAACSIGEGDCPDVPELYEDEYDDTYDSSMVGLNEPVPAGEPNVDKSEDKKTEKFAEKQEEPSRDTSKDFCENPEIIRQKREQRWEAKRAARGGNRRVSEAPASTDDQHRHKDRNKAHAANHNRRKQSDFKKSRGMYS